MFTTFSHHVQWWLQLALWWSSFECFKWLFNADGKRDSAVLRIPGLTRTGRAHGAVGGDVDAQYSDTVRHALLYTLCGFCGGSLMGLLTNPIDVVRTRIQTEVGNYGERNIVGVVKQIAKNEGVVRGFSKGVASKVTLAALEGVMFGDFYQLLLFCSRMEMPFQED